MLSTDTAIFCLGWQGTWVTVTGMLPEATLPICSEVNCEQAAAMDSSRCGRLQCIQAALAGGPVTQGCTPETMTEM